MTTQTVQQTNQTAKTTVLKRVIAFTDGAASHNQSAEKRCGGWASVLMLVDKKNVRDQRPNAYKELVGGQVGATNNQMELEAIRQTLLVLKQKVQLVIVTDSEYVIGVLGGSKQAKKNLELVTEIKQLMTQHEVSFVKVTAHSGNPYNERVDRLAKDATRH